MKHALHGHLAPRHTPEHMAGLYLLAVLVLLMLLILALPVHGATALP